MNYAKTIKKSVFGNVVVIRLIALAVLAIAFTSLNKNYLSTKNLINLMTDISPYFLMSMGITFVLMVGSIDLSIGAVCSASACLTAVLLPELKIWAFVLSLLLGIIGGAINGFLISRLKIVSFIATLGTMSIWSSFAYLITGTQAVTLARNIQGYIAWNKMFVWIIPVPFIVCMVLWGILYKTQRSTTLGKYISATGVNERAAQIAGVNVTWVKMLVFIISGLFAGAAGIAVAAKLKGSVPYAGDAMTMLTIASVVLGGTSMEGGKGGMLSTLIGTAMVIMIQNGLNMAGITSYYQDIVFGALIIVAIYFSIDRSDRNALVK